MDYKIIGAVSVATLIAGIVGYSVFGNKKQNKTAEGKQGKQFDRDLLIRILQ